MAIITGQLHQHRQCTAVSIVNFIATLVIHHVHPTNRHRTYVSMSVAGAVLFCIVTYVSYFLEKNRLMKQLD